MQVTIHTPSIFPERLATLTGHAVCLRALSQDDASELFACAEGQDLWRWYPARIASVNDMAAVVTDVLKERDQGTALPFVITDHTSGMVLGSSRYFNPSPKDRRLEIGWTWIRPSAQGTHVNLETKYLMFLYSFETLGCQRVELKTDSRNVQSQRAMLKLGLKQEGTLRSHMLTHDGYERDTVYFSVIRREWPEMKARLEARLSQRNAEHANQILLESRLS